MNLLVIGTTVRSVFARIRSLLSNITLALPAAATSTPTTPAMSAINYEELLDAAIKDMPAPPEWDMLLQASQKNNVRASRRGAAARARRPLPFSIPPPPFVPLTIVLLTSENGSKKNNRAGQRGPSPPDPGAGSAVALQRRRTNRGETISFPFLHSNPTLFAHAH